MVLGKKIKKIEVQNYVFFMKVHDKQLQKLANLKCNHLIILLSFF